MSKDGEHAPKTPTGGVLNLNIPPFNANSSDKMSALKDLNSKRSSMKGRITKYKNFLSKYLESESMTRTDYYLITQRFDRFREISTQFCVLQLEIETLNQTDLDGELDIREEIELDFSLLIAQTQCLLEKHQKYLFKTDHPNNGELKSNCSNSCHHSGNNTMSFKLPTIKIATFDGTYYKWLEFRDTFSSLIHNNDRIEPIHKFYYLNSYLEGEASRVISNLEVSASNYKEAWVLLCERYNNEKQLISNHLNSLLNIQPVHRDSAKGLRFVVDHISKNLRALNTLGEKTESWDTLIIHLVSAKLDNPTSVKWEEYKNTITKPSLKDFFTFLKSRSDVLESIHHNKPERLSNFKCEPHSSSVHKHEKSHAKSFAIPASSASASVACVLCNGSHRLYDCASFLAKPVDQRISEVLRLKLCLNCLRKGHSSRQCRLGPCSSCKERHNSLLHKENEGHRAENTSNRQTFISTTAGDVEQDSSDNVISMSMTSHNTNNVLLSTALVEVCNPHTGQHLTVRALLDSGSQTSLITNKVKNYLNLAPQLTRVDIVGVGNKPLSNSLQRCDLKLKSRQNNFETNVSCLVLPQISSSLPNKTFDMSLINLPRHLELSDPTFNQSAPVDMLIGADLFWSLIEPEKLVLGPNKPIMIKSKLGWVLTGPFSSNDKCRTDSVQCNHLSFNSNKNSYVSNEALNDELTKFWTLEQIPTKVTPLTDEDIMCENHFVNNTYRNADGRFCVRLPLVSEPDCLGNSFSTAKRQFLSLEKRFVKNTQLKNMYSQFIEEYSNLGHLSESNVLIPPQSYIIPHHAVLRPSSESTKLRVVFNGSSKTTSGYSLNDLQMTGPHIQDLLFNILLRFRQYSFVLSGDIEKMYRMVEVQDSDRNLQMILWRESDREPLKSFKLNTVTYGLTSSSFLSTRCLWQLGEECSDQKIKNIIQNDFVVDDLLTGSDSQDELFYIKRSVESALAAGCFNLRKYRSNLPSILSETGNTQKNLIISSSSHTLGVGWNPNEDYIHFPTNYENKNNIPTKRSILSDSCKVFDPLGLLSIFTIKPKILIQKLWIEKIDWDEPVPEEVRKSWLSFINNMKHLHDLRIPRHVLCIEPICIEIHSFCDASQAALAACVYLRSVNKQGDVTVRLICAKARVASVKPTTIPRLELCSCLLGAQLADAVRRALRCVITRRVYWSDSSIALAWLGTRYDKLKTFVANRVSMILELTKHSEWRHVPTHLNSSDFASRGVDIIDNDNLKMWWNGPAFLLQPESSWPSSIPHKKDNIIHDLPEVKVKISTLNESNKESLIDFNRYSNLIFLQRSFAYLLRFIHNCRNPLNKNVDVLQPEELSTSFRKLVYLAQAESFPKEISTLRSKGVLNSKSQLVSLNPFIDNERILRVGGRLTLSCYPFEKRHQMLLHARHVFTKLLFRQEHLRLLHAGPQLLLYSVRDFVWPIAGRDLARTTARQCVKCRRISGKTVTPIMGSLPEQRVNPDFPFASTGVDFAGPFLITDRKGRGCKITKCYLCLFVCFRYKCLHLEAVSELSKEAFILALRRFISRRGKPVEIFCDNGRNLVAAAKEIGEFIDTHANDITGFSAEEGIKFNFQPAYAPHFGGLHEAGVKSAKYFLKRKLGQTHLTFEELATLFSQIEAILNSRPLCPLSSSPEDYHPLTPGHFLVGRPLTSLPSPNLEQTKWNQLDRFKRLESLRQEFWKRWQLEYVNELQQRHKWRTPSRPLKTGDLVLMKEENIPPMNWRLGRIAELFPGKDGTARVADVKTTTGTYRRGVKYLCPLLENVEDTTLKPAAFKAPEDVPAQ